MAVKVSVSHQDLDLLIQSAINGMLSLTVTPYFPYGIISHYREVLV